MKNCSQLPFWCNETDVGLMLLHRYTFVERCEASTHFLIFYNQFRLLLDASTFEIYINYKSTKMVPDEVKNVSRTLLRLLMFC